MCINLLHKDLRKVSCGKQITHTPLLTMQQRILTKNMLFIGNTFPIFFQRVGLDNKPFSELICMLSLIILSLKTSKSEIHKDTEISNFKLYNTSFK